MNFNKHVQGDKLRLDYQKIDIEELRSFLRKNRNITQLSLEGCGIDEREAEALANFTKLTKRDLLKNSIDEEVVKALAKRDFSQNSISEEIAKISAKVTKLTEFDLWKNSIDEEGAKVLTKLTNLAKLNLWSNNIGEEGEKALANLINLTELNLRSNKIGDEGAKALAKLTKLIRLNLWSNNIGAEGAKALAKLTNLTVLDLQYNKIGDEGAKALAKLTNLTVLDLQYNKIGDEGAKALAKLTNLTKLNLSGNSISDEGAKALAESKVYLKFTYTIGYDQDGSMAFCKRLKALWSQARAKSNGNVGKLDENSVKKLFFDLVQQNYRREGIELLLNDPDKYPFLINSRDEQEHTLSHFYTHSPEMQKFFFEHGMVPEEERNQRRDDERIAQDNQSVHASPIVKRTNFFAKKLVESTKASEE